VVGPIPGQRAAVVFDPLVAQDAATTQTPAYQDALLHLLLLETSSFRYWGQGRWTDYNWKIHRRGEAVIAGGMLSD